MLNEKQLEIRRTRISGTDISAIVGVNPYRTKLDVYLDKMGLSEPFEGNKFTFWGTTLEPVIRNHFMEKNEEYDFVTTFDTTLVHPEHDFVCGTPDGILWKDGERKVRVAGLEVKTAGFRTRKDWGEPGTDLIPAHYLLQCQWYMLLTGLPHWHVAVLFGGNTYEEFIIERNEPLIEELLKQGKAFMENHVEAGKAPEPEDMEETVIYVDRLYSRSPHTDELLDADEEIVMWADILRHAKSDYSAAGARVKEVEAQIKDFIGSELGVVGDFGTITWKKTSDRSVVDWKSVAGDLGDIPEDLIEKHTTTKPGHRRFTTNWRKENE